jgi:uncharacterized membrane protein YkoI
VKRSSSHPGARVKEHNVNLRLTKSKLAATGVLAALVVGGGASIAAAAGNGPASSTAADSATADTEQNDGADGGPGSEQEAADPTFTGSVAAPAETEQADGQENAASDSAEKAALQAVATVSQSQAEQAALAAVPGTVAGTDLDAENGFVVYSVEINATDGTVTEVTVDAGNATVLAQQAGEAGDAQD